MSATVLLVDDDDSFSVLMRRAIKNAHLDAVLQYVPSGDMAIEYLSRQGPYKDTSLFPDPSVMLLDIKMPGKTGFDVLRWKQSQTEWRNLPVAMWSSSDLPEDRLKALRLGACAYFLKPMDLNGLEELIGVIQDLCLGNSFAAVPEKFV